MVQRTRSAVAHFLATEASGGIILLVATALVARREFRQIEPIALWDDSLDGG
jgi:Na+/H+ antiporter NhaA